MTTPHTDTSRALPTGTWRLDPAQTTVTVTATKLGLFKIPATLALSSGTIEIDADHEVTGVEVIVDASSYASANATRNDHIRNADFLDADDHPELAFTAGNVSRSAVGYRADGSVTVKGKVSPISVDITGVDVDTGRGSFVATATIDRNAIGVDKLPSLVIGRDLQLTVTASAVNVESHRPESDPT
ncbi:MAG: YceI family protein [Acidimicrobiales bacterium]